MGGEGIFTTTYSWWQTGGTAPYQPSRYSNWLGQTINQLIDSPPATVTVPIEQIRLGQRVIGENPDPYDVDPDFTDPVQEATRRIVATVYKEDGTAVDVELLRPASFVRALGLTPGSQLPLHLAELDVQGIATITGVTDCPPIQQGEGQVVTARFVTRHAENRVRVTLSDGTEIIATDVHPVWTPGNRQWTPAGELVAGTAVDTLAGELTVHGVEPLRSAAPVYNLEVNGHHVYRVADVGVLVHNTGCSPVPDSYFNTDHAVNMEKFRGQSGSTLNASGEVRNKQAFWEELLGREPGMFSKGNRYRIEELGLSPRVDKTWISSNPSHRSFNRNILDHHHVNHGPIAVPVPQTVHQKWTSRLH